MLLNVNTGYVFTSWTKGMLSRKFGEKSPNFRDNEISLPAFDIPKSRYLEIRDFMDLRHNPCKYKAGSTLETKR